MKILVANLGSTSFKYGLFEMGESGADLLAKGGYERVTDYGVCIGSMLESLEAEGHLSSGSDLAAVGFKTVLGKGVSGCVEADAAVLEALEGFESVAPAHNPAYAEGIRAFERMLPSVKRVALFETAFYQWMAPGATHYAIPKSWREAGVRRHGFHGASHKYIAERSAELLDRGDVAERVRGLYVDGPGDFEGPPLRVVSCHLGGSSSVAGIRDGLAIGGSMGFSPQSGPPQNNRVGDLDAMAIPYVCKTLGLTVAEAERVLSKESGLLGLSGRSNDLRDIRSAALEGDADARLACEVLIDSVRHWAGSFLFKMGGMDALVFTGGIGENNPWLRSAVCAGLEDLGLRLDEPANDAATGGAEARISADGSRVAALVVPANEELVIAREVYRQVRSRGG